MSQSQSIQSNINGPVSLAQSDSEVVVPAKRRQFTVADKLRILDETDRCEPGQLGAILRREGLYSSHLSKWRQQRAAGVTAGLGDKPRGATGRSVKSLQQENRKLQRRNVRLHQQLHRAEIIIEFQKKAAALFETTEVTEES